MGTRKWESVRTQSALCAQATKFVALLFVCSAGLQGASAQRTQLKPAWNIFSTQRDIAVGKQNALQAARQLPLCNDPNVDAYLTKLGMRLVEKLPTRGVAYPFEFHCVNDKAINAFALPGGYVFINRGAIEVSDNEAQLAGVMAHELSHVALRHGTAQASKAQLTQGAVGLLGGIFGGSTGGALVTEGLSLAAGGVLLRYSRSAETQADVMGTQVLYDAGYDPRALAQFFEKLEAETKGKNPPEFFSDHPNPDHRLERVDEEVDKLGGVPPNAKRDSSEFEAIKREVLALPVVKKSAAGPGLPGRTEPPPAPSRNFIEHQTAAYTLRYPDNWKKYPDTSGSGVSLAPDGGVMQTSNGWAGLAYGLIVEISQAQGNSGDAAALEDATQKVIGTLQKSNPSMKITRQSSRVRLNGEPGLSTYLVNDSHAGGQETDWIISVLRPEGLVYFVCIAPQNAFHDYEQTFNAILDSVQLSK
jgi:Zn-dependent protease with chaperone function